MATGLESWMRDQGSDDDDAEGEAAALFLADTLFMLHKWLRSKFAKDGDVTARRREVRG